MTKNRSFLAVTLASIATCGFLLPGCGGGGGGIVTPTNTPLPTNTPSPTSVSEIGTATANLNVVVTATDNTNFGDPTFVISDGQVLQTASSATIAYPGADTRYISVSGINLSTATAGATYALGNTTTLYASYGLSRYITSWGGTGKSTGNLVVQSVDGKKVTFQLQNVVLSQSGGSGSNGNSTLAITGTLTATLN